MSEQKKIKTIVVDTLTGIMNEMYMTSMGKPNFDKWRDWGQDVWRMISRLQDYGFEIILVLGEPGKLFV